MGIKSESGPNKGYLFGGIVLLSATSILIGFGSAVASVKKKNTKHFLAGTKDSDAIMLAFKALKIGTFYSVTGVGILSFAIYKLFIAPNNICSFRK